MIDHASIPVRDLAAAGSFYDLVLTQIGLTRLVTRNATIGYGKKYPEFWLNYRPDAAPVENPGGHICLRAPDAAAVRCFYATALAQGAINAGEPGDRLAAMTTYFGAFILDPDGNKVEVVSFPKPTPG